MSCPEVWARMYGFFTSFTTIISGCLVMADVMKGDGLGGRRRNDVYSTLVR